MIDDSVALFVLFVLVGWCFRSGLLVFGGWWFVGFVCDFLCCFVL